MTIATISRTEVMRNLAQARLDLVKHQMVLQAHTVSMPYDHPDAASWMQQAGLSEEHRKRIEDTQRAHQDKAVLLQREALILMDHATTAEKHVLGEFFQTNSNPGLRLHYQPMDSMVYMQPQVLLATAFCEEDETILAQVIAQTTANKRLWAVTIHLTTNGADVYQDITPYGSQMPGGQMHPEQILRDHHRFQVRRVQRLPLTPETSADLNRGMMHSNRSFHLQPFAQHASVPGSWDGYMDHGLLVGSEVELQGHMGTYNPQGMYPGAYPGAPGNFGFQPPLTFRRDAQAFANTGGDVDLDHDREQAQG